MRVLFCFVCLSDGSKHPCEEPTREAGKDRRPGYLVPTPLILANGTSSILPKARPGLPPDKENFHSKPWVSSSDNKSCHGQPCVPSEVNVVVIPPPPPTKPKDPPGRVSEGALSRGPLSYEALVQLRKSASMKKTPRSPTDEYRDWNQQPSVSTRPVYPNHGGSLPRTPSDSPTHSTLPPEPSSRHSPPVVVPKPRRIPTNISQKIQKGPASPTSVSAPSERRLSDPQRVRMEALQKLGLMRDQSEPDVKPVVAPPFPTRSHSSWDITQHTKSQTVINSQGPREPRGRPVQSSTSFHHHPRSEKPALQPTLPLSYPIRPSGAKAATLERSGVGLGSFVSNQHPSYPLSATLSSQRSDGYCPPPPVPTRAPETVKTAPAAVPYKPSSPQGFSVVMVPGMGEDRKQALRKLGLLKD